MELIVVIGIVLITNLVCFFLIRYDKQCARQGKRRIPEWMLFLSAGCFGAFGGVMAMNILRHKTRHWYDNANLWEDEREQEDLDYCNRFEDPDYWIWEYVDISQEPWVEWPDEDGFHRYDEAIIDVDLPEFIVQSSERRKE